MQILKQEQFLPISLQQAWDFFSTPNNLNKITPKDMLFEISSELTEKMYAGLMILYKLQIFGFIPINWATEITHIENHHYFVDEQRKGPYNIWHHEHHFKETENGVLMTDILHYDVGKSIFGWIAGKLFVHQKVKNIFHFRRQILDEYFTKK